MPYPSDGTLVVPQGRTIKILPDPVTTDMQKHKTVSEPLFEHKPCKEDVLQGEIGDCYLLAAINAILVQADGPDLLESIFRDNKNGYVTIRLYKEGAFRYLLVRKTVVHESKNKLLGVKYGTGKVLHGQGALWVSLLEKAYVAFMRVPPDTPVTYKNIEGGAGQDAMAAIVGGGVGFATGSALKDVSAIRDILFQLTDQLSSATKIFKQIPKLKDDALTLIADSVFAGSADKRQHAENWLNWNTANSQEQLFAFLTNQPSLDKFKKLMDRIGTGLDHTTLQLVLVWIGRYAAELWPGEVGSGIYTTEQLNYFMMIQRMLATNRSVTVGTHNTLQGKVSGVGHSGGESKVDGLAAKHEYSVMDTKTDALGRRFVKVRNPWGQYGREYQTETRSSGQKGAAPLKPVANQQEAESWIELTDLSNNFTGINVGPPVNSDNRSAFTSELQGRLANQPGTAGLKKVADLSGDRSAPNLKTATL